LLYHILDVIDGQPTLIQGDWILEQGTKLSRGDESVPPKIAALASQLLSISVPFGNGFASIRNLQLQEDFVLQFMNRRIADL
jgi:hypothetical protein